MRSFHPASTRSAKVIELEIRGPFHYAPLAAEVSEHLFGPCEDWDSLLADRTFAHGAASSVDSFAETRVVREEAGGAGRRRCSEPFEHACHSRWVVTSSPRDLDTKEVRLAFLVTIKRCLCGFDRSVSNPGQEQFNWNNHSQ